MSNNNIKGVLLAFAGSVVISPDALLVKMVKMENLWTIICLRYTMFMLTTVLVKALALGSGQLVSQSKKVLSKWSGWLALLGFCMANIFFIVAITYTTAANVLLMYSFNTIIVGVVGHFVFKDLINLKQLLFLVIGFAGVVLVFVSDLQAGGDIKGNLAGIGLMIGMSIYWLSLRQAFQGDPDSDPGVVMIPGCIISVAIGFFIGIPHGKFEEPLDLLWISISSLICMPGGIILFSLAPKYISGAEVSLIALFETVLGPLWVFCWDGETPSIYTYIGGAALFISLIGFAVLAQNKTDDSEVNGNDSNVGSNLEKLSPGGGETDGIVKVELGLKSV